MSKGSNPRNCFSTDFRDNYDDIDWSVKTEKQEEDKPTNEESQQPKCGCEDENICCANE